MLLKFTTSPQILYNNMIYCSLKVQTIWELQRAGCLTITNTVSSLWEGLHKKEDTKRWCYVCHTVCATVNETEAAKRKATRNEESLNVECLVRMKRRSCLGFVKKPGWILLQRGEVPECDNCRIRFVGVLVVTGFIVILGAWLKRAMAKKRIPWIM